MRVCACVRPLHVSVCVWLPAACCQVRSLLEQLSRAGEDARSQAAGAEAARRRQGEAEAEAGAARGAMEAAQKEAQSWQREIAEVEEELEKER